MESMRITKIKAKKGEYFFSWEVYQDKTKNWDKHTLTCKDPPREELKERLQVMANHVVEICEFEQSAAKKIVVSGITISYTDDNRYLVITAMKDLTNSKAPLIINTPARPELPENDYDEKYCLSDELDRDLSILEEEAWKYINGDRAQMSLFTEQEQEADLPEEYKRDKAKLIAFQQDILQKHGRLGDSAGGAKAQAGAGG